MESVLPATWQRWFSTLTATDADTQLSNPGACDARLSWPRHCSKCAVCSQGCNKHNHQWCDLNLGPLTLQSGMLTTRPLRAASTLHCLRLSALPCEVQNFYTWSKLYDFPPKLDDFEKQLAIVLSRKSNFRQPVSKVLQQVCLATMYTDNVAFTATLLCTSCAAVDWYLQPAGSEVCCCGPCWERQTDRCTDPAPHNMWAMPVLSAILMAWPVTSMKLL